MIKICICSCTDAERFENTYRNTLYKNIPKTIHWVRKSDGSFETGTFQNKEINGKVKCQCGKYMKTHLHEHTRHDEYGNAYGKSWYEMIANCSCNSPKPIVIEIEDKEIIKYIVLNILFLSQRSIFDCSFGGIGDIIW